MFDAEDRPGVAICPTTFVCAKLVIAGVRFAR
jgi:hypothetical protein